MVSTMFMSKQPRALENKKKYKENQKKKRQKESTHFGNHCMAATVTLGQGISLCVCVVQCWTCNPEALKWFFFFYPCSVSSHSARVSPSRRSAGPSRAPALQRWSNIDLFFFPCSELSTCILIFSASFVPVDSLSHPSFLTICSFFPPKKQNTGSKPAMKDLLWRLCSGCQISARGMEWCGVAWRAT